MSMVVKYRPYSVGKYPVMATPTPRVARATTAKVCSLIISNTNTVVKERNPGISLILCRMPISIPVKAALSTAKLLSSACQVLNAIGMAIDISISRAIRLENLVLRSSSFNLNVLLSVCLALVW